MRTQYEILEELKENFSIDEFVDETVYNKYGEKAWRFFDMRLLHTMVIIRKYIGRRITINSWKWGGGFSQRGLRTNISQLVRTKNYLYLSAHLRGAAVDFDVEGMTASEVRAWIKENEDLLPYHVRLENILLSTGHEISWVHLDVDYEPSNPKVYLFNV